MPRNENEPPKTDLRTGEFGDTASTVAAGISLELIMPDATEAEEEARRQIDRP